MLLVASVVAVEVAGTVVDVVVTLEVAAVVRDGSGEGVGSKPGSELQAANSPMTMIEIRRIVNTLCQGSGNRVRRPVSRYAGPMTDESHDPFGSEPSSSPPASDKQTEDLPAAPVSAGIAWGAILLLLGISAVVIFAVQNTATVPVRFLGLEGEFSLALVILVAVGTMVVLTELFAIGYRRRRLRRRMEQQELKRYRGGT